MAEGEGELGEELGVCEVVVLQCAAAATVFPLRSRPTVIICEGIFIVFVIAAMMVRGMAAI